ncbi:MAG TPA: 4-phosphopantetheinyl transferase, partial [Dyadobacter sp.]|nr:4-phosphopantetheinyl transferase [Dyadobacter sp.]
MGLVYIKKVSDHAQLGLWQISETVDTLLQPLTLTSAEEIVLLNKRSERKKKEWLAVRNLLKMMVPANTGLHYDTHGKPFLNNSDAHISISHSAEYAVVYIDTFDPVGVDIQIIKPDIS